MSIDPKSCPQALVDADIAIKIAKGFDCSCDLDVGHICECCFVLDRLTDYRHLLVTLCGSLGIAIRTN